jgi:hypothetical protein
MVDDRLGIVRRNALAFGVTPTEVELRARVTLLGGAAVPLHGFGIILRDATAMGMHEPEVVLRASMALLGSPAEPLDSRGVVLSHATTAIVHQAERELSAGVTLLGGAGIGVATAAGEGRAPSPEVPRDPP